ncbi:hypothetical protein QLH51_12850 [Sphingomonas sp. 2R-10]|uniref:hypothetical protein n=1 Tax=Sphingomonas sp. 2R-10 TaxID=3045148 RepID=UPI000F781B54|nr:hypothetical protein [Sphingomonas sp. 2R-10]MDJ0277686.1 hypothetical protein [Sphingomonas sp. 2R-10]
MADRVSARIAIGGTLPRSLLDDLKQHIDDEDLRVDWEGEPFDPENLPVDTPLDLKAHEVAWGYFEQLEQFCRDHGLAYVRCSGSFGPDREVFTGSGEPRSHAVTEDDEFVFSLETIRELGSIAAIEARAVEANFTPGPLVIVDDLPSECAEATHG